jgi:hypothetical protein
LGISRANLRAGDFLVDPGNHELLRSTSPAARNSIRD